MFKKILVANRGEIAERVLKTAKLHGYETVTVFSEADKNSGYTKMSDQSVLIGPPPSAQSYLQGERIIAKAKELGCDAIHPGFGFLSENADFAQSCHENQLTFIGPPPEAIRAMGSKALSKQIMEKAGVPVVPGYHGPNQEPGFLKEQANLIGYPLLIKAVMGGGGKGMRIVRNQEEFDEMLGSAKSESIKSFKDDKVILERYIERPRHIEIQIFGDKHGNFVYLFERDCSVQRRYQKVVEEAPSGISQELREKMGQTAIEAAKAVGYYNAGTVEFIFDLDSGEYFFMEMNTRLQVEHPVTEAITNEDLVEWQLRVAQGEKLPKTQNQLSINGHAIECRIYSEDPFNQFFPGNGRLKYLRLPEKEAGRVRLDTGVREGDEIPIYYDPMISKLIVWGPTREQAIQKTLQSLNNYRIGGLVSNISFLSRVMQNKNFISGDYDLSFIARHSDSLTKRALVPSSNLFLPASLILTLVNGQKSQGVSPQLSFFRLNTKYSKRFCLEFSYANQSAAAPAKMEGTIVVSESIKSKKTHVDIQYLNELGIKEELRSIEVESIQERSLSYVINGERRVLEYFFDGPFLHFFDGEGNEIEVRDLGDIVSLVHEGDQSASISNEITTPMPGTVLKVMCAVGDEVKKGSPLVVLEAMKMEHVIRAPKDLKVKTISAVAGGFIGGNKVLMTFE